MDRIHLPNRLAFPKAGVDAVVIVPKAGVEAVVVTPKLLPNVGATAAVG